MSKVERIPIAPGILEWARRTAGYDVSLAARKLDIKEDRLRGFEAGEIHPTVIQLRKIAALYKRPLAVLLLPAPPKDFDALRDFRRTGEIVEQGWSPALHAEYKRALSQREIVLEISEISPSSVPSPRENLHVASDLDSEYAGTGLRELLGMDLWRTNVMSDPRAALRAAVDATEAQGILVLQTRGVDIAEMRGFSISAWPFPIVILNGSDWPRPKLFTLLHELCHLALNSGGLCDLHESPSRRRSEDEVEHYCNQVAGAALMPASRIKSDPMVRSTSQWDMDSLMEVGNRFGASGEAFLLRLITLGLAGWDSYRMLKPRLDMAYARARAAEKAKQRQAAGGPGYFTIKARNMGRSYIGSVLDAYQARAISSLDAADYLDVKFDQLGKLKEAALG